MEIKQNLFFIVNKMVFVNYNETTRFFVYV